MTPRLLVLALCLAPVAIGCGGDPVRADAGARHDAGFFKPNDAGLRPDGMDSPDAGALPDATDTDLGLAQDTGAEMDATSGPDVEQPDLGEVADTGVEQDSGTTADSGVATDSGIATDGGVISDSGVQPDAMPPVDTGVILDSGSGPDSGPGLDAAGGPDVSPPDVGTPDAGTIAQGGGLMITEILVNTTGVEWFEIFNSTGQAVNLANYTVTIASQSGLGALAVHPAADPTGLGPVMVAAGGYVVGVPSPTLAANIPAFAGFVFGSPGSAGTNAFGNAGDVVTLRSPGGAGDALDYRTAQTTPGANVAAGQFPIVPEVPLSLDPPLVGPGGELGNDNGSTWCAHVFRGGSPGAANRACNELVLSEVLYDFDQPVGAGNDDGQEFIEIAGPAGGSLTNVYVAGIEGSPTGQGTLNGSAVAITGTRMPLDGLYVVADQLTGMTTSLVPNADQVSNFDLENGPDAVQLYRSNGTTHVGLDAFAYGAVPTGLVDTVRGLPAIEGMPVPDLGPTIYSVDFSRSDDELDTGSNVMDFRHDPSPTPGQRNGSDQLAVTSIVPNNAIAAGMATIVITGVDFTDDMRVSFAQTPAPTITCPNPPPAVNVIRCTVPYPAGGSGMAQRLDVTVSTRVESPRSAVVVGGFTWTTANNETNTAAEVDYAVLQFPATLTVAAGQPSALVYGRLFEGGRTDAMTGGDATIIAELGYGATGSDPRTTNWTWTRATFNIDVANDDEYRATFVAPAAGSYLYTYRYSLDGGLTWTYADRDGAGSNPGLDFSALQLGALTVN